MYVPLDAIARVLTAPRPPLPAVLDVANTANAADAAGATPAGVAAAELAARTELESHLAEISAFPEGPQGLLVHAPTVVWLAAVTSGLHARRFFPYLGPELAFGQHVSTMIHRTLLYSYWDDGWHRRDHLGRALRQFEGLRHYLLGPAEALVELQHVRLHLADLSNYIAFAAYRLERAPGLLELRKA
jgi:hypothetical protein